MQTEIVYKLPHLVEVVVAACVGVALAGLAIYIVVAAFNNIVTTSLKLETIRHDKSTKALNNWQKAYDDEHALHMQDVSDLSAQLIKTEKELASVVEENERIKARLAKLKVIDLALEADDI